MSLLKYSPLLLIVLLAACGSARDTTRSLAPKSPSVWSIAYARTLPGEHDRYLRFLAQNWAPARERAARPGFVVSYYVLTREPTPDQPWDAMLVTEYADSTAFAQREAIFTRIFALPEHQLRLIDGKGPRELAELVGDELSLESRMEMRAPR